MKTKWIDKVGTNAEELVNLVAKKSKKFSKATDDPVQYKKAVKIMNDYLDEQEW